MTMRAEDQLSIEKEAGLTKYESLLRVMYICRILDMIVTVQTGAYLLRFSQRLSPTMPEAQLSRLSPAECSQEQAC